MRNIFQLLNARLPKLPESKIYAYFKNADIDRISHIKFIGNLQAIYEKDMSQPTLNELRLYSFALNIKNMHLKMVEIEDKSIDFIISKIKKNTTQLLTLSSYQLPNDRTTQTYERIIKEIDALVYFRKRCITYMEKEINNKNWQAVKGFYIAIAKIVYKIYNLETTLRKLIII